MPMTKGMGIEIMVAEKKMKKYYYLIKDGAEYLIARIRRRQDISSAIRRPKHYRYSLSNWKALLLMWLSKGYFEVSFVMPDRPVTFYKPKDKITKAAVEFIAREGACLPSTHWRKFREIYTHFYGDRIFYDDVYFLEHVKPWHVLAFLKNAYLATSLGHIENYCCRGNSEARRIWRRLLRRIPQILKESKDVNDFFLRFWREFNEAMMPIIASYEIFEDIRIEDWWIDVDPEEVEVDK